MKGVIIIDVEKCLGCKGCELQCAVEHSRSKKLHEAVNESPAPRGRVRVEAGDDFVAPLQCRHCADAPCVKVCPTGALEKYGAEFPVLITNERCIGCTLCIVACPFGVIAMDSVGGAVINCDLCPERRKEDRLPACVEGCPTGALRFKRLEEVAAEKRKKYLTVIARESPEGSDPEF